MVLPGSLTSLSIYISVWPNCIHIADGISQYVTRSDKTSLIAVKYTYSFYGAYHLFCGCYSNSVSFIEFLRIFCIYDEVCIIIAC